MAYRYFSSFALWICCSVIPLAGLLAQVPSAEKPAALYSRRAFVVAVASYENAEPLKNTLNDARLMAETLKSVGFQLHGDAPLFNPDATLFKSRMQSFLLSLDKHTEAVIYFAGHGVQAGGDNLLLAKDFEVNSSDAPTMLSEARDQSVVLSEVMDSLEKSEVSLAVVFLDCCRDSAFLKQAPGLIQENGLRQPRYYEGELLVSFSARHGETALDGEGTNSPYTEALARFLQVPGLSLNTVLQRVGSSVKRSTGNRQKPWYYGNLQNEVFLAGDPVDARALGSGAESGAGLPETLAKMLADVAPGQAPERLHRQLGPPNITKAPGGKQAGALMYESWSSKQFGLQTWYAKNEGEWGLVAYVMHQHEARRVPIYRGTEENMLFVLGKTTLDEFRKTNEGHTSQARFEVEGRYAGVTHHYYLGRPGGYWHYLIPARNTARAAADADTPIDSYGAVLDDQDRQFLEHLSFHVIAPMHWSEDGL